MLTQRKQEVLEWLLLHTSLNVVEISKLIGTSYNTLQVNLSRRDLRVGRCLVSTREDADEEAIRLKLLELEEPEEPEEPQGGAAVDAHSLASSTPA